MPATSLLNQYEDECVRTIKTYVLISLELRYNSRTCSAALVDPDAGFVVCEYVCEGQDDAGAVAWADAKLAMRRVRAASLPEVEDLEREVWNIVERFRGANPMVPVNLIADTLEHLSAVVDEEGKKGKR